MTTARPFLAIPVITALLVCCSCQKQPISAKPPHEATKAATQAQPSPPAANQSANPPSTPALQTKFSPRPTGPLGDLGTNFVNTYEARRVSVLAQQGPFVIVTGSSLTLHVPGKQIPPAQVLLDPYHALKDVAHAPFAAYLLLLPVAKQEATIAAQARAIDDLLARIDAAQSELTTKWFTDAELDREKTILASTAAFLRQTQTSGSVSREALLSFARNLGPLMLQNAWDGGCLQVVETHRQMMAWKHQLKDEDWQHLVAINRGTHQARYRNAATQYFHWLINDEGTSWSYPGESMRVLYIESLGKDEKTTEEFATVLIDADASLAFFGDSWRLSEDVLSNGAAECIKKLPEADRLKE